MTQPGRRRWRVRVSKDWASSGAILSFGVLASVIQVITIGKPNTVGLCILAAFILLAISPLAYQAGRKRENGVNAMLSKELRTTQSVIEGTLGAYRPYQDVRTVVFDIGETADRDLVEEIHCTKPSSGPVVYWCMFEALSRSSDQLLTWENIKLTVTRTPEQTEVPQKASIIQLQRNHVPRALIAFAPPRREVRWTAQYSSPGFWDRLRRDGQLFSWTPPSAGPDDTERRSPVQSVTFMFRLPSSMGRLRFTRTPKGVVETTDLSRAAAEVPVREYTFAVADVAALFTPNEAVLPLEWFIRLDREGAR